MLKYKRQSRINTSLQTWQKKSKESYISSTNSMQTTQFLRTKHDKNRIWSHDSTFYINSGYETSNSFIIL